MRIAILVPTKRRPEQFKRMVDSVALTASSEIKVLPFLADSDDYIFPEACTTPIIGQEWLPTVHKWNLLAEYAKDYNPSLFMLGADDMVFESKGWDKALLDHYDALENKIHVYHLQDSRDKDGTPHPIVTREYIEAMGYFLPPIFLHWYCDSWTVQIAKENACFTHLRDHSLAHIKPSDEGKPDSTHTGIREHGWHNRDKYVAEKCADYLEEQKRKLGNIIIKTFPAPLGKKWRIGERLP